ncbi:MAG: polysaccharide deacetylase family protein [Acetobacteraceae bacterium]
MPWKQGYTISDEIGLRDSEVRWPEQRRCCLTVVVDLSVARGPEGITPADLERPDAYFAAHDGLDQLLAVLRHFAIRATFAVPAVIAAARPERIRALLADGHEIAANGLRHEDVSGLSADDEKARLDLATSILTGVTGTRPTGWFCLPRQDDSFAGGTISPHTVDLLIAAGYQYLGNGLADDIPHYWVADFAARRAILTLPYYYHFDDQWFLLFPRKGTGLEHADDLFRNWRAEFRAQYKRGRQFSMVLHPGAIGWCNRVQMLEEFLTLVREFPDVWNPTSGECARYWSEAYPQDQHLRLAPSIWRDHPGSLS